MLESIAKFEKVVTNIEDISIKKINDMNKDNKISDENDNDGNINDINNDISEQLNEEINSNINDKNIDQNKDNILSNIPDESDNEKNKNKYLARKRKKHGENMQEINIENFNLDIKKFFQSSEKKKLGKLKKLAKNLPYVDFEKYLPEFLIKDAYHYFLNIDYYKKNVELNYSLTKYEGYEDKNIAFKQTSITGECLDYALLMGERQNKKFLGIQIKCYSPDTVGGNFSDENKANIKDKCKNIINGIKNLLNIDIKEWHYVLILYFNPNDKDGEPNQFLIKHCKKNNLEYILYNPETKKFYDRNKMEISKFDFNDLTNLDSLSYNFNSSDIYDYKEEEKLETKIELTKGYQQYFYDSTCLVYQFNNNQPLTDKSFENYLVELNKNISDIIGGKSKYSFIFLKRVNFKWIPKIPKKFCMSAYINKSKSNFIFILHIGKSVFGIDFENKKKIKIFETLNLINSEIKYFYLFKIVIQNKR